MAYEEVYARAALVEHACGCVYEGKGDGPKEFVDTECNYCRYFGDSDERR